MKKLAAAICLALSLLGGCVVYGPGPAANGAWAGYDSGYEYGLSGYDRPITYRSDYAYSGGYGAGYGVQAEIGVGNGGYYGSYYDYGY
ncbi:MAG: hypothetical protein RJB58_1906 [Pseudomonadota bacterium]|jgi:hypothetical protein